MEIVSERRVIAIPENVLRAAEEYRDALFDLAEGHIEWPEVIVRLRELRRSLPRRRGIR